MKINALLVDPYRGELRHIEVENSISTWHNLLQCRCCDVRKIMKAPWGTSLDVWFDDEFLVHHEEVGPLFRIMPWDDGRQPLVLSGYGLVCGCDTGGNSVSVEDEGFAADSRLIQAMLRLQFEHWDKRLNPDDYLDQVMRTPETEPGLSGQFRYLDNPVESDTVRVS